MLQRERDADAVSAQDGQDGQELKNAGGDDGHGDAVDLDVGPVAEARPDPEDAENGQRSGRSAKGPAAPK